MITKQLGHSTRGSDTGRPIMVLLDVLGQRWVLRILWELHDARLTFRELRRRCDDVSPTVLNKRIKALRALSILDHDMAGYGLTAQGQALTTHLLPLHQWAEDWAQDITN